MTLLYSAAGCCREEGCVEASGQLGSAAQITVTRARQRRSCATFQGHGKVAIVTYCAGAPGRGIPPAAAWLLRRRGHGICGHACFWEPTLYTLAAPRLV